MSNNYVAIKLENSKPINFLLMPTNTLPQNYDVVWSLSQWNIYVNTYTANEVVPTGAELPLKIQDSSGDKYIGVAFAKTQYDNNVDASFAFDGNSGTRHYSEENEGQNHYCGIMMSSPTYLTTVEYQGEYYSSMFRLEGSKDTTNGNDGIWDNLGTYDFYSITVSVKEFKYVYSAYRLVWIQPISTLWANVRNIILFGKQ